MGHGKNKFYIVNFILSKMKKEIGHNGFHWRKIVVFVVLILFVLLIWSWFFTYKHCSNKTCFEKNLKDCNKAQFIDGDDMIFKYSIRGKKGSNCEIGVELLQGELNNADSKKLERQVMTCILPLGVVTSPESDIGVCHGLLKEGLQDLIIRNLHSYLVQNLGKLNFEAAELSSTE
jgi:hypothetical protein